MRSSFIRCFPPDGMNGKNETKVPVTEYHTDTDDGYGVLLLLLVYQLYVQYIHDDNCC